MAEGFVPFTIDKLKTSEGINELNRILQLLVDNIAGDGVSRRIYSGYGTPESNITADIGSIYMRFDGGASTSLYVKESGTANTGWVAK